MWRRELTGCCGHHIFAVACGAAVLTTLGGCNAKTISVSGTISLHGEPVGPGTVIFLPTKEDGPSAVGTFAEDGRYQLTTFQPNDGAVAGSYQVIIQGRTSALPEFGAEGDVVSSIPLIYADPQASGLTAEVKPGANTLNFALHLGNRNDGETTQLR